MKISEIKQKHEKACSYIVNQKLGFAFDLFYEMAKEADSDYYRIQLDKNKNTYQDILKHAFNNVDDPQKNDIYKHLQKSILETGDILKEHLLIYKGQSAIYKTKDKLKQQIQSGEINLLELLESLTVDEQLEDILEDTNIQKNESGQYDRNEVLSILFRAIWFTDKFYDTEKKLVGNIINSEKLMWYDKSLFVSALTLSVLHCFNEEKINLLIDFIMKKEEQVWQRAFVGLILAVFVYNKRISLYPDLIERLESFSGNEEIEKNIEAVVIQLIKAKETEEITRKWEEEILPEIMKMRPEIEKKLDLENIVSDKFLEDKNPEWERVFEDSPDLLDKLQQFSQMQVEGSDVFMSAFARLKHFPFFNRISNWFIPFYKENKDLEGVVNQNSEVDIAPLVEKLESSYYMCNSDKYSFCLNLQLIPDEQKNTMMHLFNEEMKQMKEIGEDEEILNSFARTKSIYTQYIQDIYRFFKLHPLKNEIDDVFSYKLDIYNTHFYNKVVTNEKIKRNIAEFYFERNHFDEAIEVFRNLKEAEMNNAEVLEKIGYAYQRKGDYENALDYYLKAELFDTNKAWINKKIALCYRYLNNPEKALEYYQEAEKFEPENLYIQAYIGHSLFQLKKYEEALKYYFKLEYLAPENEKIRRPIAWCSFILGKYETAENYLNKLIEKEENYYDYVTLGHVYWIRGQLREAENKYIKAVHAENGGFEKFAKSFLDDKSTLTEKGIDPFDITLMIDKVKFSAEE